MNTVTAKQTVYLYEGKAVTQIPPGKNGTLLVAAGTEIPESRFENIEGAAELIEGKSKKPAAKEEEPKKAAKH